MAAKKCTCPHGVDQHNELGCFAPLATFCDNGERDLCRCMFKVHRDLELV